jgi:hypothetical protein
MQHNQEETMADQGYTRLPRQLAAIAVFVNLLVFALNMGWLLLLSPYAETMLEHYSHADTLIAMVGYMPSGLALIYVTIYGSTRGCLERGTAAGLASPRKTALVFSAVFFVMSILMILLTGYTTPRIFMAVHAWKAYARAAEISVYTSAVMLVVSGIELIVVCLLARSIAFWLARGPTSARYAAPAAAPGSAGQAAALICCLTYYVLQAKSTALLLQIGVVYTQDFQAWRAAATMFAPAIPALLAYAGLRCTLAAQVDRAWPLRTVATALCTFLATQVTLAVTGLAWVAGVAHISALRSDQVTLVVVLLIAHVLVVMPICRGFSHLFYRTALRGQAAAAPEQVTAS